MPISPLLKRFVDDELGRAPALIERTLAGTLQLLRDSKDSPLSPSERSHHFAIVEALQAHGAAYQQAFVLALQNGVREALNEQDVDSGDARAAAGLELMDESSVDIDIEISRAIQLIDTTAEWELRELQTFTSTLVGQTHISAESNPFRPQVCASALWQAACAASPVSAHRTTLLRLSSGVAAGLLKNAWAAACTRLEAQGVEPGIYRSIVLPSGSTPARGPTPPSVNAAGAMATVLASMPGGSAAMQVSVGNAAVPMGTPTQRATAAPSAEFEQALMRLDELLRHVPVATVATEDRLSANKGLNMQRSALLASAGTPGERQVIELISRVFDNMLTDTELPLPFVPVLARLRASVLRVALRDPDLLTNTRHAVWQLLNRIGEAALANPLLGDPRAATLLGLCQALAEQLGGAVAPDATLYRRAQMQVDTLLAHQMQAEVNAAQLTVKALHEAEQRELLEQRLAQRLVDQMVPVRTTPNVRRFVTGAWAKVLAESILREGEQGEATRGYIKLVDELLWSVQLPDHPKSRQRLVALLPGMLQRLRAGMQLIGLPAAEQETVLDELMGIHSEALRPSARSDVGALTPEQIVQRMRDEVLPATTGYGAFSDSVIDLASMETVPAALMPDDKTEIAADPLKRVEALRPGDRQRVFLKGRWRRVQLLWRSEQGLYFLFAGEAAARTHSVTRRALERLAGAGLMLPLETQPLVQRALDAVVRDAARVEPG